MEELVEKIRVLGWSIEQIDETIFELGKFSPAGQDFHITIDSEGTADLFLNNLYKTYSNFDVSYETYLWLDKEGHGQNGAPYDMRDLYNDMESCRKNILGLYRQLT